MSLDSGDIAIMRYHLANAPKVKGWHVRHKNEPKHGGFITREWHMVEYDLHIEETEGAGRDNVIIEEVWKTEAEWYAFEESDKEFEGW